MIDSEPLVSVIIPFYNRIDWTIQAVESVLNQSYQNYEIILVDDGSIEPVDSLYHIKKPNIFIIRQSNQGPAKARNLGMKNAKGKYIAFLDSDDLFLPEKLELQVLLHEKNPHIWLSHTSYQRININGDLLEVVHSGEFSGRLFPKILSGCPIAPSTVMISNQVLKNNLWYEEEYRISEDIIFFSKIARYSDIIGIDVPLTLFKTTSDTHASRPEAQIKGSQNVIHFMKNNDLGLSKFQEYQVLSNIYIYFSINYHEKKDVLHDVYYFLAAFIISPQKKEFIIFQLRRFYNWLTNIKGVNVPFIKKIYKRFQN